MSIDPVNKYFQLRMQLIDLATKHVGTPLFKYWMNHYDKLRKLTWK